MMNDYSKRSFRLDNIGQLDYQLACINPEFENNVISHILGNYMTNSPFPLYLAIHGPKGEGKTFQTLRACSHYGITVYYISGAELCGSYEKDSIAAIEKNLDEAIFERQRRGTLSVFIIDDFHLSIASVDPGVAKTVNSQILTGWLMNQADRAKSCRGIRIPFIFLGNDFVNLYPPLTRDGRMDFYEWKPSDEIKTKTIFSHFEDYITTEEQAKSFQKLVKKYKHQPISFFAELKNDLLKSMIKNHIFSGRNTDTHTLLETIDHLSDSAITDGAISVVEELDKLAQKRNKDSMSKLTQHESREKL